MITRDTVVVGVKPSITPETFKQVLKAANSPAAGVAKAAYAAIKAENIPPEFILAIFWKESRFATDPASMVVKHKTFNPGNCRSSSIGDLPVIDTEKGPFVDYANWLDGFKDAAHRLTDSRYPYVQENRKTIAQIIDRWAPSKDNNNPVAYTDTVVNLMNQWIGSSTEVVPTMTLKIALSAGHHNSDGGSPVEAAITGPLCHFYAMAFRELGCDVRVITPNDGLGMYQGGLQDVAAKVVEWSKAGWTADLFLETHTQGLGDTSVRGAFAIYPDWNGDIDLTVKNGLGLSMVKALSAATGIPVWSSGIMSEKATGVGISGYRLGIFLRTQPAAANTTRLIIEHGAHSNPQDLTILQNPEMQQKIANASAKAAVDYLQGIHGPRPADDPIAGYVAAHGGEAVFGKRTSPGLYGSTPGAVEADYEWAHLFVNKATGLVEAQMKDRANPQNFSIGPGVMDTLRAEGLEAVGAEQYFTANSGQVLGQRSFTYAKDKDGVTYQVQAIEDIDGNGKKSGTWTRQIWKFEKEIK
jgi:N-acetylmuramoyl-L-alanine amidase